MIKMGTFSSQLLTTLGIEDPEFHKQCDGSDFSGAGQWTALMGNSSTENGSLEDLLPAYQEMISAKSINTESFKHQFGSRTEGVTCNERPVKIPRSSTWASCPTQQPFPPLYSTNSLSDVPIEQQIVQPLQLNYFACRQKTNEKYDNLSPRTPGMPGDPLITTISSTANVLSPGDISTGSYNLDTNIATSMKNLIIPARMSSTQDHIMAERKRRERLSQKFIALSAIIPGLKKMDKISVLEDAIKYVKKLQERLDALEQQPPKKTVESVVYVNKSHISFDNKLSSIQGTKKIDAEDQKKALTPEIEARVVHRNVLVRIHCQKKKGLLVKYLAELEKMQMTILNASVISFSDTIADLTLTAEMDEGCNLTVTEIVKSLQNFLKRTSKSIN